MAQVIKIKTAGKLLTERPKGMSYEDYCEERRRQNKWLRGYNEPYRVNNGRVIKRHILGRLEGVRIPASVYTKSRDFQVVIEK